jgi:precorrin-4 methylase
MTVHFIGAGPGAADLITLRGLEILSRAPVCLYAGSLVPQAVGEVLGEHDFRESALYSVDYQRRFRGRAP